MGDLSATSERFQRASGEVAAQSAAMFVAERTSMCMQTLQWLHRRASGLVARRCRRFM